MPNFKKKLTGEEFASIGSLAFHARWKSILATEMRVDLATIQGWVKHGTPDGIVAKLKMHLGARRDNISGALDLLLEEPFKPWERGDELLKHYETLTDDPTMIYSGFEDNKDMVVRAIADLFHYCAQKNIDINDVTRKAKALYNSDPKNAKLKKRGVRRPRRSL